MLWLTLVCCYCYPQLFARVQYGLQVTSTCVCSWLAVSDDVVYVVVDIICYWRMIHSIALAAALKILGADLRPNGRGMSRKMRSLQHIPRSELTRELTEIYDREHSSLLMPSLTLLPFALDRSTRNQRYHTHVEA